MREKRSRIIEIRKKRNLTQKQLARKMKMSRSAISGYELGYIKEVSSDIYDKLARCLNVSVDYLEGYSNIEGEYEWI